MGTAHRYIGYRGSRYSVAACETDGKCQFEEFLRANTETAPAVVGRIISLLTWVADNGLSGDDIDQCRLADEAKSNDLYALSVGGIRVLCFAYHKTLIVCSATYFSSQEQYDSDIENALALKTACEVVRYGVFRRTK